MSYTCLCVQPGYKVQESRRSGLHGNVYKPSPYTARDFYSLLWSMTTTLLIHSSGYYRVFNSLHSGGFVGLFQIFYWILWSAINIYMLRLKIFCWHNSSLICSKLYKMSKWKKSQRVSQWTRINSLNADNGKGIPGKCVCGIFHLAVTSCCS